MIVFGSKYNLDRHRKRRHAGRDWGDEDGDVDMPLHEAHFKRDPSENRDYDGEFCFLNTLSKFSVVEETISMQLLPRDLLHPVQPEPARRPAAPGATAAGQRRGEANCLLLPLLLLLLPAGAAQQARGGGAQPADAAHRGDRGRHREL